MENTEFSNQQLLEANYPHYESVDFQRISPDYKKVIYLNLGFFLLIIMMIVVITGYFLFKKETEIFLMITVFAVLLSVLIAIINIIGFRNRRYAIREKDIIYQSGLLKIEIIIIPFNRIQHTELEEGWYSRKLGLKSVAIYTAGGDDATMKISGLPKDIAEKISQLILNKIQLEQENYSKFEKESTDE